MEQNAAQRNMWNAAGKAGLVIGLASAACMFAAQLIGQREISAMLSFLTNGILWLVKFIGCIWLMRFFMKKYASSHDSITNSDTMKFGMAVSLLSALVHSAFTLANVTLISPDLFDQQIEQVMQIYAQSLDSNTIAQIDKIMSMMPQITFFSNLFYCSVYGVILSFILSRNIPSRNPFESNN